MPDLAAISAILTSIKTAADIAKALREADVTFEKAESKLKLADLMTALADARMSTATIQEQLSEKDQRIRDLEVELATQKQMTYSSPFYWRIEGDRRDGPYCQRCYDKDRSAIHLQDLHNGYWECAACNSTYQGPNYQPRQSRATTDYDPFRG